jgi:hypothetical protein
MAYLNFSEAAAGSPAGDAAEPRRTTGFSALEWSVIMLAERDKLSSLRAPGALSIAMGAVFGGRSHNPRLADPQLEALRRMAVISWHYGYVVPGDAVKAFLDAGFTQDQYELLVDSIGVRRRAVTERRFRRRLSAKLARAA